MFSFSSVRISGAAVGTPLTREQASVCMVEDMMDELTPLATAYARARGMCCAVTLMPQQ